MRIRIERSQRPKERTVREVITDIRNHLLGLEMDLGLLRGRDSFFQDRYEQAKAMRLEFDAFPIWYGLEEPSGYKRAQPRDDAVDE